MAGCSPSGGGCSGRGASGGCRGGVSSIGDPPGPPLRNSGGDVTDGHPKTDQMGLKAGPPPAGKPGSACEVPLWRNPSNPPFSCLFLSSFPGGHLPGCLGNTRSGHRAVTAFSVMGMQGGQRVGRVVLMWESIRSPRRQLGHPQTTQP